MITQGQATQELLWNLARRLDHEVEMSESKLIVLYRDCVTGIQTWSEYSDGAEEADEDSDYMRGLNKNLKEVARIEVTAHAQLTWS